MSALKEFERQRRLISQSLSMHSALRDRYTFLSRMLTLSVLVMSIVALPFAFVADDSRSAFLGIEAKTTTWLGVLAVVGLAASVFELVFGWASAAGAHQQAVTRLSELRAEFSSVSPEQDNFEQIARELSVAYFGTLSGIVPVPEKYFNRLKAAHLRKVELSRMVSDCPGLPLWIVRLRVIRRAWKGSRGK